jgi:hypothetical protein
MYLYINVTESYGRVITPINKSHAKIMGKNCVTHLHMKLFLLVTLSGEYFFLKGINTKYIVLKIYFSCLITYFNKIVSQF